MLPVKKNKSALAAVALVINARVDPNQGHLTRLALPGERILTFEKPDSLFCHGLLHCCWQHAILGHGQGGQSGLAQGDSQQ